MIYQGNIRVAQKLWLKVCFVYLSMEFVNLNEKRNDPFNFLTA